jgi:hypothetical protein
MRIDRNLGHAFRFANSVDRLANDEPPPVEAWMLSSCNNVAFNASEQHRVMKSERNPNFEIRMIATWTWAGGSSLFPPARQFGFRFSDFFRHSDFGFRISDLVNA